MSAFFLSRLRVRLMFLVVLAMLPVLAFILFTGFEQRQMAIESARQDALRVSRLAGANQENLIEGAHQLLLALSRLPEVQMGDKLRCSVFLADLLKRYSIYSNFGITDAKGMIYISAIPIAKPVPVEDRAWFQRTQATFDFSVGDYQRGRITKNPTLNFGYPLLDQGGHFQGTIFAALNLNWVSKLVAEAKLPPGASVLVIDSQGMILARGKETEKGIGKSVQDAKVLKAIVAQNREGSVEVAGLDGVNRL